MRATRCECGAVTVEIDGENYSMTRKDFLRLFPGEKVPRKTMYNCDYCVNHWGIDLCGCGSGEKFGECDCDLPECGRSAQSIEAGVTHCTTDGGGWGARARA